MNTTIDNWRTQIRKGYLELCILLLIHEKKRLYGFEILELMTTLGLPMKEGTLYPLLNRMTTEGILSAVWETQEAKGHPRKFYSVTDNGKNVLKEMRDEFNHMTEIFNQLLTLSKEGKSHDHAAPIRTLPIRSRQSPRPHLDE